MTEPTIGATSSRHEQLTQEQVVERLEQARADKAALNLEGTDLSGVDLSGLRFEDVVFGDRPGAHPAARLERTSFRGSTFVSCSFTQTELERTDFRGCDIDRCDFRFATFGHAQLANATIRLSDFYRASFRDGTVLANTRLELVSLTNAHLEETVGLEWRSFRRQAGTPALVQENGKEYAAFLTRTAADRPGQSPVEDALDHRLEEAADVYRGLSGHWTSRGQFNDAGSAYVHSRRLERESLGPRYKGLPFRPLPWLVLWAADILCGFGESLGRVFSWIVLLALLPGFVYWRLGGVDGAHGLADNLLFSAAQLTSSTPPGLSPANSFVSWIGLLQTFAGVALLGLFGFVLGIKIRNS